MSLNSKYAFTYGTYHIIPLVFDDSKKQGSPLFLDEEDTWNLHFSCVCKTRRSYSLSNITNALSLIVAKKFVHITFKYCTHLPIILDHVNFHPGVCTTIVVLISSTVYPTSFPEYWGQKKSKDFYNTALGLFIIMLTLGSFGLVFIALKIFRSSSLNNYRTYSESFLRSLDVNELLSGIMCQSRRKNNNVSSPSIIQNTFDFVPKDINKLTHEICVQNTPFSSKDTNATSFFTSVLKEHS
ncbi:unnamed protein product [Lepeophtheirus salmonis]|uniref:(salmon louse) hypothetical protein n=1 Tax=Lepeophtheirus salmonis TaxID=72036 RepID=A0A7R8CMW7_LEPSM|nr:unnamed protein product [Lepeophtheirus salmonis]CAF2836989.1 unnamed protein product [Lepeophtheirus salmonis]